MARRGSQDRRKARSDDNFRPRSRTNNHKPRTTAPYPRGGHSNRNRDKRRNRHWTHSRPPSISMSETAGIRRYQDQLHPAVIATYADIKRSAANLQTELENLTTDIKRIAPTEDHMEWTIAPGTVIYVPPGTHPEIVGTSAAYYPSIPASTILLPPMYSDHAPSDQLQPAYQYPEPNIDSEHGRTDQFGQYRDSQINAEWGLQTPKQQALNMQPQHNQQRQSLPFVPPPRDIYGSVPLSNTCRRPRDTSNTLEDANGRALRGNGIADPNLRAAQELLNRRKEERDASSTMMDM